MGVIDGHALRLVNSGGVAVIDVRIRFGIERNTASAIESHRHAVGADGFDIS